MAGRPEVGDILVPDRVAFADELVEDLPVVDGVPGDDGVGEEVRAQSLLSGVRVAAAQDLTLRIG